MKKLTFLMLSVLFLLMLQSQVFANSNLRQEILDELKAGIPVAGTVKHLPDKYLIVARDFLNTSELTDNQLLYIQQLMREIRSIWISTGKVHYAQMSREDQLDLQKRAADAAASVGASIYFDGRIIFVTTKEGRMYTVNAYEHDYSIRYPNQEIPGGSTGSSGAIGGGVIKVTGIQLNFTALYAVTSILLSLLGLSFILVRKYNFNEG